MVLTLGNSLNAGQTGRACRGPAGQLSNWIRHVPSSDNSRGSRPHASRPVPGSQGVTVGLKNGNPSGVWDNHPGIPIGDVPRLDGDCWPHDLELRESAPLLPVRNVDALSNRYRLGRTSTWYAPVVSFASSPPRRQAPGILRKGRPWHRSPPARYPHPGAER